MIIYIMHFTRIYVINLERRPSKREHMENEISKIKSSGIDVEFFNAVDGDNHDLTKFNFKTADWTDPSTNKSMTMGEVGCALSHYSIWKKINELLDKSQASLSDMFIILEDDVQLSSDLFDKLDEYCDDHLICDLLYLHRKPLRYSSENKISKHINVAAKSYWTCGYALSGLGAKKLLSTDYINNLIPVDEFLPIMYGANGLEHAKTYISNDKLICYACDPSVISLTPGAFNDSDTYHSKPVEKYTGKFSIYYSGPTDTDAYHRFKENSGIYGYPVYSSDDDEYELAESELSMVIVVKNNNPDCYILTLTSPDNLISIFDQNPGGAIVVDNDLLFIRIARSKNIASDEMKISGIHNIIRDISGLDFEYDHNKSTIKCKHNWTCPFLIYGSSQEDHRTINRIGNYTGDGWNYYYGYTSLPRIPTVLPKVYITTRIGSDKSVTDFIDTVNYPTDKLVINNSIDRSGDFYSTTMSKFLETDAEYYFFVDYNYLITNPDIIMDLIGANKKVIAPIIRKGNELWSNFWGDIDDSGYYRRSADYIDIVNNARRGIWNVPYITGVILIHRTVISSNPLIYHGEGDPDMILCEYFRKNNIFMFADNQKSYGHIIDADSQDNIPPGPIQLYDIVHDSRVNMWAETYLHPDFFRNRSDLSKQNFKEIADGIYTFPLFSEKFCDDIISLAESTNTWSGGKNNHIDHRLGKNYYENVPTVDVQLFQLGLKHVWEAILRKFIAPIASHLYNRYKTKDVNLAFVVRYNAQDQASLQPHHDASTYTVNIALNRGGGIDYEGGGCRFIRQGLDLVNQDRGMCCIHPGRLTAYHEGLAVSSGTRYILVSFIN